MFRSPLHCGSFGLSDYETRSSSYEGQNGPVPVLGHNQLPNASSGGGMTASYYTGGYQDPYHQHALHHQHPQTHQYPVHHPGYHQGYHHQSAAATPTATHHHQYYTPMAAGGPSHMTYQSPQTMYNYNQRYPAENNGVSLGAAPEDNSDPSGSVGTAPCSSASSASTATYLDLQHLTQSQVKHEYLPTPYVTPSPTLDLNNPLETDAQQQSSLGLKTANVVGNGAAGLQTSHLGGGNTSASIGESTLKQQQNTIFEEKPNGETDCKKSEFIPCEWEHYSHYSLSRRRRRRRSLMKQSSQESNLI